MMKKYFDKKIVASCFLGALLATVVGVPGYLYLKTTFVKA